MSYAIGGFGWLPDPLDPRDAHVRLPSVRARLRQVLPLTSAGLDRAPAKPTSCGPLIADLRPWCSPIKDQGPIGSCTANAVVGALEYFERKTRGAYVDASRLFLYRATRRYLGWVGKGDTGAFVRAAIKSLRLFGAPPEQYWPYDVKHWDDEPDAFTYAYAQNFKAIEYFRLESSVDQLKSALRSGLPFMFGFTCFGSLRDPSVGETGIVPYPGPNESVIGGHAVLAVGYTDSHVLIRNSWGASWGEGGYGYLPWTYFDRNKPLADDTWALINAQWVPNDEAEVDVPESAPRAARAAATSRPVRGAPRSLQSGAYIQVANGADPLRHVPVRLASTGVVPRDAEAPTPLPRTARNVSLTLREIQLSESFDWALFGNAKNEIYVAAVAWDLSGRPPCIWPPEPAKLLPGTYDMEKGDRWRFVGDGLPLWTPGQVTGALYVRLVLMESDQEVRDLGKTIEKLHEAVDKSALPAALAALVAGAASAGTLTAIAQAAWAVTGIVAGVLKDNGDDLVALFDGSYAVASLDKSRDDPYSQRGANVVLGLAID